MPNQPTPPVSYPKRDLRRMLQVLGAIDELPEPTLVNIAERTGLDKKTVTGLIANAMEQAHVGIVKSGSSYEVVDWGPVLKKSGSKLALSGALMSKDSSTSTDT